MQATITNLLTADSLFSLICLLPYDPTKGSPTISVPSEDWNARTNLPFCYTILGGYCQPLYCIDAVNNTAVYYCSEESLTLEQVLANLCRQFPGCFQYDYIKDSALDILNNVELKAHRRHYQALLNLAEALPAFLANLD